MSEESSGFKEQNELWQDSLNQLKVSEKSSSCNMPKWTLSNLLKQLKMREESSGCKEQNELWQDLQEQLKMSEETSGCKKQYEYVGLVDGNLVQKATSGPDIPRLMERDKRFSPRILDHGSGFCSLSRTEQGKKTDSPGR